MTNDQLEGKRVLVTGAGKGMGREIAIECARQGASWVTLADVDTEACEDAAAAVAAAGASVEAVTVDLAEPEQVRAMVEKAVAAAGGLDTLVNNAGVIDSALSETPTLEELSVEVWDKIYAVNVRGMWLATKYAAPHLRSSGRGPSVVNAASVAGMTGYASPAYASSKGAVIQLTRSTAIALSPEVRCNAYCPGSIETPMALAHLAAASDPEAQMRAMTGAHLIPRFGRVAEIAKVVCFLASDSASFVTGAILPVDAGTTAWRGLRD